MPVTTRRSQAKKLITTNDTSDVKKSSTCSTNKNGTPPCKDGFSMKLNKNKEKCCYKNPNQKPKSKKVNTGTANDALKIVVNQHESIKDLIKNQLSKTLIDEARLSQLVHNKEELYKKGESDVKKFFSKWLKGGNTLARYFLHDEGMRLYERVENLKLMVAPSKQHKYMLDHLKYKYKHLRLGKLSYLKKEEKERAKNFWETFANEPLARKNSEKFNVFKTAIQDGMDSYFYLRKKVYEPELEEYTDDEYY
tara:strand:+ start:8199 stop:8951 length:753 start_codon:yes stop_codon:yes gene_type:complete